MIIDVHYHLIGGMQEEMADMAAAWLAEYAVGQGIEKPVEEIKSQILERFNDPEGEKMLKSMDDAGIDVSLLCVVDDIGGTRPSEAEADAQNKAAAAIARKYPERVVAFAGVDPRRKNAPEILRKCLEEYGMKGIKFHPDNGYYPNGKEAYAVLEVAAELQVPLLTHTGILPPPSRNKYVHPIHLDDISVDFPELKVIAAHMGLSWWREWCALAQLKPNLFGDLAMWQFPAVVQRERFCRELREIIDVAGAEKILFATDAPVFEPIIPNKQWVDILKGLPESAPEGITFTQEEVDAILGNNARKVLGL